MQSFLSCFSCGDSSPSSVVAPENVKIIDSKVTKIQQSQIKTDDNKSHISVTTVTFLTNETTPTKDEDDDQEISRRIQILRKKDLPERKAMESEFVKQNLVRSNVVYLIDKKWSQDYTKFLRNLSSNIMPPINNEKLLDQNGELKINMKEKQDYFIVTEKIWKFVNGFYGGGPVISKDYTFPVLNVLNKKTYFSPIGIQNPLNLCYMIAVLQMLSSIDHLNGYMLKKLYSQNQNEIKKKPIHNLFYRFIKHYNDFQGQTQVQEKVLKIKEFALFFQNRFNPKQQHDAHEFLLYFLEQLQEELKSDLPPIKKPVNSSEYLYSLYFRQHKSIIDKLFAGQLQTTVDCLSCGNKSITYIPFLELVLPIVKMNSLEECLDSYFVTEKLSDLYQCQNCKKRTKATKSQCITKTPTFLLMVLGKFSPTTLKKVDDRVTYPAELKLKKYSYGHCGETNYYLHSLIVHKGSKSNKGHYYLLGRRGSKNKWYYLNDSSVKDIEGSEALDRDPYILIYERVKNS